MKRSHLGFADFTRCWPIIPREGQRSLTTCRFKGVNVFDPFTTMLGSTGSKVGEDIVRLDVHERLLIRTLMCVVRSGDMTDRMHDGRNRGIMYPLRKPRTSSNLMNYLRKLTKGVARENHSK